MTDPADQRHLPQPEAPSEDAAFEVETDTLPDGRRIHYYRWPDAETQHPDEALAPDV